MPGEAMGACHFLEIPFGFGTLHGPAVSEFTGTGPAATALAAHPGPLAGLRPYR
jgi:hypothetical protein